MVKTLLGSVKVLAENTSTRDQCRTRRKRRIRIRLVPLLAAEGRPASCLTTVHFRPLPFQTRGKQKVVRPAFVSLTAASQVVREERPPPPPTSPQFFFSLCKDFVLNSYTRNYNVSVTRCVVAGNVLVKKSPRICLAQSSLIYCLLCIALFLCVCARACVSVRPCMWCARDSVCLRVCETVKECV